MQLKSKIDSSLRSLNEFVRDADKKQLTLIGVGVLFLIILSSLIIYFRNTEVAPAHGGSYTEGLLGSPRFLNPVYSQKSETDKDLTQILYSGLMRYDESNSIVPYLAEDVQTEDGRVYHVKLREDIFWSDGEEITSDDVIFTIEMIQSRSVQSPLRVSWEGVRTERVSEKELTITLETPSPLFIEKLTLKPIPEHAWREVDPEDFQFSDLNLDPITSGPYKVSELQKEDSEMIRLTKNENYFGDGPFIEELNFKFFQSEEDLFNQKRSLDGFGLPSIKNEVNTSLISYEYALPRYFALFFNLDEFERPIRKALRKSIDKEALLASLDRVDRVESPIIPNFYGFKNPEVNYDFNKEEALDMFNEEGYFLEDGRLETIIQEETSFEFTERMSEDDQGEEVRQLQSCLIDLTDEHPELFPDGEVTGYFDSETTEAVNRFQELFREDILDPHGFSSPTGMVAGSTQAKLNEFCGGTIPEEREQLTLEITTIDHPLMSKVIEILEEQWSAVGVTVESRPVDHQTIQSQVIEDKNFNTFLFGISMGSVPDPFRWWHSRQIENPGLNFTKYQNETADELLTDAVTLMDDEERINSLQDFQDVLLEDKPAIFLYSPRYVHMVSDKVSLNHQEKIIDSSQRFKDINKWYINTKRVWKNN